MKQKICCICKKEFKEFGNNPYPLEEKGLCCDECNEKVIEARITRHFSIMGKKSWEARKKKLLEGSGALTSKLKVGREIIK